MLAHTQLFYYQDAPPLISALTSSKYHMKWTWLVDLPASMWDAYVAVQDSRVYVTGGGSPVDDAYDHTFVFNINTDHWSWLPPSGHYYGIPCIIGKKLAIIGGILSVTDEYTNKVSTFDETSQTWISYYPDLLNVRCRPGVVTHQEHVIVAGGQINDIFLDEIEVFNWMENTSWRKSSVILPEPMLNFTPTIANNQLFIVGHSSVLLKCSSNAFMIPVEDIIRLDNEQQASTKWVKMNSTTHLYTALIPDMFPPVVVGGRAADGAPTSDISMYDVFKKSWRKISSLSSARNQPVLQK